MAHTQEPPKIIPPHRGYKDLQSYQMSEIVYDGTVVFCDRFISPRSRTLKPDCSGCGEGVHRLS